MRHLLEIDDLTPAELGTVIDLARDPAPRRVLQDRGMALVFEKPSARTRSSMEMAVVQLGGHPITIRAEEVGLGDRETVEDVARTLACYHAAIGARVFDHATLERMAAVAGVPVVNLLSDDGHPMQALADVLTLEELLGQLEGRSLAYLGDGNNVCRSLALAAGMLDMEVRIATPAGYELPAGDVARLRAQGIEPLLTNDPHEAVAGVDAVYTDVWASMGREDEAEVRRAAFAGFTVDEALLAGAAPGAAFLHCLPAHRGEEVSAGVLEGRQSHVWQQATNRMHAARGLLSWLLGEAQEGDR
jgi:ornithine carbamoyltransferase